MRRMIHTLTALALAVCLLLSLAACGAAGNGAGKYPFKTIRMIVPYGANGTTDLVGRKLGAALGRALGVSVVIDNQPGASGSLGCRAALDAVARRLNWPIWWSPTFSARCSSASPTRSSPA